MDTDKQKALDAALAQIDRAFGKGSAMRLGSKEAIEIETISTMVRRLHDITEPPESLTKAQQEALRCIAEGDRHAAAAAKLGITESAFKARLISARERLMAKTTAEALQRAKDYRLL